MRTNILIISIFIASIFYAQDKEAGRLDYGVKIAYTVTDGDLNKYWGNKPGIGLVFKYPVDELYFVSAEGILTHYSKLDGDKELPEIINVNLHLGIGRKLGFIFPELFCSLGLSNSVFYFSGSAANLLGDNNIEQEIGYFVGVESKIISGFLLESSTLSVSVKHAEIFSVPEQIGFTSFELNYFF